MKQKAQLYISSIILVSCLFLFVTGSPILNKPLVKDSTFPVGTLISWIGIISLTIIIYFIFNKIHNYNSSNHKILRFAFKSIVVLASIWGLIGFLLANNWAFTFQNHCMFRGSIEASYYFWIFTAVLVLFPIISILIIWLMSLSKNLFNKSKTDT